MFRQLYRVRKKVQQSTEFTAYFYRLEEAEQFAKKLAYNEKEELLFTRHNSVDGSIKLWWQGDTIDIVLDDNCWITNTKSEELTLMPLGLDFVNEQHLDNFIKNSQK